MLVFHCHLFVLEYRPPMERMYSTRLWWLASLSIYTHVDVVMVFDQVLIKPSFSKSREIRITSHADGIACD